MQKSMAGLPVKSPQSKLLARLDRDQEIDRFPFDQRTKCKHSRPVNSYLIIEK